MHVNHTHIKFILTILLSLTGSSIIAAPLNIPDAPLITNQTAPPLTMIVMGRDHSLYYEAYNDASDLNGDGTLDIRYNPAIDYYGYFDSYKCYSYSDKLFTPRTVTSNKKCSSMWSGDFLNYLTTPRIDTLRKVLYGGYRYNDSVSRTILERSFIPQDAHSWGKEYTSPSVDGYNISDYAPLSTPSSGKRHLFANTTLVKSTTGGRTGRGRSRSNDREEGSGASAGEPLLRVASNVPYRIWEWVSINRPVADSRVMDGASGPKISRDITDYVMRIEVCVDGLLETNCRLYPNGQYKPIGILQDLGENDAMKFGLLTGSYNKNLEGGVLRKNVGSITDEIIADTGQFEDSVGIIKTIDRLRVIGFGSDLAYNKNCGWIVTRALYDGECNMWGNPIGEMVYETLRYFAGKSNPTAAYATSGGDDGDLGLPNPSWQNPYDTSNNPYCAQANMLIISNVNPTYDSKVPGSPYAAGFSSDLTGFNVASLGSDIWQNEIGGNQLVFIGHSGNIGDGAPSAKLANSFANIHGLVPEGVNARGGYTSAGVAYYGRTTDINAAPSTQNIYTYAVALNSPLPTIRIPVNGKIISLVPFAKSVAGHSINRNNSAYQPTNTIVDYYVESLTDDAGCFRINFEDVEQGADHDMDAITKYCYTVNNNGTVTIDVENLYAAGNIVQHMGYTISGTTADGIYLEVRDLDTRSDVDYFLDTPPGQSPGGRWLDSAALPTKTSRTFVPGRSSDAIFLKNPLWYAAKWGGFIDKNGNNKPDKTAEWDVNNDNTPDNYFLASNAGLLPDQLKQAFNSILDRSGSMSPATLNSGVLKTGSKLFQAVFESGTWTGQLLAYTINNDGTVSSTPQWDAAKELNKQNYDTGRKILTYKPSNGAGIAFRYPVNAASPAADELDVAQTNALRTDPTNNNLQDNNQGKARLDYLRGSQADEQLNGGNFRDRESLLGDIINSAPHFIGVPSYPFTGSQWPTGAPELAKPYADFKAKHASRAKMVYVGSNDGIFHGFNADTGTEEFAYIPAKIFPQLAQLTDPAYSHKFLADGSVNSMDVFFGGDWHTVIVSGLNKGGQGIFALDVTEPDKISENNADTVVLWEFTDEDDAEIGDLGFTYSQPAITRMANGKWAAVFGNGYNNTVGDGNASTTGNAVLYIVDVGTGQLIKKLDTGVGTAQSSNGTPNGLATPVVVDVNGDTVADFIYVGDLQGNMWKISVENINPDKWHFAYNTTTTIYSSNDDDDDDDDECDDDDDDDCSSVTIKTPRPFFIARDASGNRQAITSRPIVNKRNGTTLAIAFGTGKFLEPTDRTDTRVQTFYTLFDNHSTPISGRSQLLQQSITDEITSGNALDYRITSNNELTNNHRGWYIDLVYNNARNGERIIAEPIIRNGKIIFTTMIPESDACGWGGTGWLMEMDMISGARLTYSPFDVNQDGGFSTADFMGDNSAPPSGIKSTVGMISSPAIMGGSNKEFFYLTGSSGDIQMIVGNPGNYVIGRQSWRQLA